MTIDDAIENLKAAKRYGYKSIIISFWTANMFGRIDNEEWECDSISVEDTMDWSRTHEDLSIHVSEIDPDEEENHGKE